MLNGGRQEMTASAAAQEGGRDTEMVNLFPHTIPALTCKNISVQTNIIKCHKDLKTWEEAATKKLRPGEPRTSIMPLKTNAGFNPVHRSEICRISFFFQPPKDPQVSTTSDDDDDDVWSLGPSIQNKAMPL